MPETSEDLHTYLTIRKSLVKFLAQDLGTGDITTECIIAPKVSTLAEIVCKSDEPATIAGLKEASMVFEICGCSVQSLVSDGVSVENGCVVMKVRGLARAILKAERTALNLIMRMSGIATETRKVVKLVRKANRFTTIACTRKTATGLGYFDKKAVELGGGWSHRLRLDDMLLIKHNHLALNMSIKDSTRTAAEKTHGGLLLECEVKNLNEMYSAIDADVDIVMLDNFSLEQAEVALAAIKKKAHRKKFKTEISGGIGLQNIVPYARLKPDIISLGYLTHSTRAIDFSLRVISRLN